MGHYVKEGTDENNDLVQQIATHTRIEVTKGTNISAKKKIVTTNDKRIEIEFQMFECESETDYVHYTLVCDHKQSCPDNSDEFFCVFDPCPFTMFHCSSGECIPLDQYLDDHHDCYDLSDEITHHLILEDKTKTLENARPPSRVTFTVDGVYNVEPLYKLSECTGTHFLCPDSLCLPVYLLCNGVKDCHSGEDELGCDHFTCPGYYR